MLAPLPGQQLKLFEINTEINTSKLRKRVIQREKLFIYSVFSLKKDRSVLIRQEIVMDNVTGIFLRKEVEELRKQGESWGRTKEEIDQAILRALGGNLIFSVKCNLL